MNQVVAHFLDGRILKGTSMDIAAGRTIFHIRSIDRRNEEVNLKDLKALFFVRSLEGDPKRSDARDADADDSRLRGSTPITVRFADNETIVGLTNSYPPSKAFFFIVPVDPGSNNIRILVNRDAVVHMESLTN
jgi:hypothetical protein